MTNYILPETHEAAERKWVENNISKGGVFIDVGADTGTWTIPLSKHFDEVYAIEPSEEDVRLLKASLLERGITNVKVIQEAASFKIGRMILAAGLDEPEWYSVEYGEPIPDGFTKFIYVKSTTIDSLNLFPKLIKVDVEGWGGKVLEGASKTLANTDFVVFEIHNDNEKNFMIEILAQSFNVVHKSDSGSIWYWRKR